MGKTFNKLEDVFDLPDMDSLAPPDANDIKQALEQANNLEKEFDQMNGYDQHDVEMDELAGLAIQAHKDLQELGMNVEVRHAGEIFSSSSQMLKIAVDAKNNKVEKKLKLLRLQLDKMKLDKQTAPENTTLDGTAVALDRNEILKQLRQMSGNDK
jgi:RNase P/RNase MRP subunit p29